MNLLLLTPQPAYPPHQGTAIRNWGILRHLAGQHAVTLITFGAAGSLESAPELHAICKAVHVVAAARRPGWSRLLELATGKTDLARRLWSTEFADTLRRVLQDNHFDIVQVEGLELGSYLPLIRERAGGAGIVYDAHNAEITLQKRAMQTDRRVAGRWPAALYSWLQLGRLARFEAEVCRMADAVTVVSAEDGAALAALAPGLKPMIVPNGIDLAEYQLLPVTQPSGNTIVFTGKMDYRPNLDAAMWLVNQILPRLQTGWPDIELQLVGQNPPPALLRLHAPPAITITGAVPDTRPFIAGAAVYAAPLRMGGGTRFKLLEAMALARPIVSTRLGAEGFDVETGREMLLADGAEEFAQAVLKLLNDHGKATEIGANGRRFVELNYDWRSILPRLDAVHAAVLAPCRPASD